ncbi:MAG: Smr/MutS family protein [Gammaproteobacteria bacterium]|nr:Smr/MutS family protein [Gammaproteobacteria bacterium]
MPRQHRKKKPPADPPATTGGFSELVGPVEPVRARRRVVLRKPAPAPKARFARADEQQALRESLAGHPGDVDLATGEELSFRRHHVRVQVLKDLRRGRYTIQDELDLHGLTADEARGMLREFMADVIAHGHRCVRIVHGKGLRSGPGGPVLKARLNRWLPQWQEVLAYTSAPPRDGGTGALYVLLTG